MSAAGASRGREFLKARQRARRIKKVSGAANGLRASVLQREFGVRAEKFVTFADLCEVAEDTRNTALGKLDIGTGCLERRLGGNAMLRI